MSEIARRAKLGISPIAWSNDDLPELGGDTPLATCLADSRDAGFLGTELGGKFPTTRDELSPLLASYGLRLVGGWYSGTLLDADLAAEQRKARGLLALFRDCGASMLVYGETAGTIQNRPDVPLSMRRRLTAGAFAPYGEKLTRFAEFCIDEFGIPLAFHHHMGTAIQDAGDIDGLMAATGPAVGLLYDTGHLVFAGADPLDVLERHAARVVHVHAKDIRRDVVAGVNPGEHSFLGAVKQGVFTVPGDGGIDFDPIVARLAAVGYEGWFIVEAEQDPAAAPPREFARIGYRALSSALARAGYRIETPPPSSSGEVRPVQNFARMSKDERKSGDGGNGQADLEREVFAADDTGMVRNESEISAALLQAGVEIPADAGAPATDASPLRPPST